MVTYLSFHTLTYIITDQANLLLLTAKKPVYPDTYCTIDKKNTNTTVYAHVALPQAHVYCEDNNPRSH